MIEKMNADLRIDTLKHYSDLSEIITQINEYEELMLLILKID
jgi:hypothetical protein